MSPLSHFDDRGASRMVDVGGKDSTLREARAEAYITLEPETLQLVQNRALAKGDVWEVSRLAGIMAAKRTSELIPLCHPLSLESITLDFESIDETSVRLESRVSLHGRTGVEMEALTAVSIAALTFYDMCKSQDKSISIGPIRLLEKSGGKSGHFVRQGSTRTTEG